MERVDANLIPFAKNNPSGHRFAFGTDTATDDINANYNDNIKRGWGTTPNEFPELEDFNAMAYTSSYLTAYLYQMGIPEWNNKQNYRRYSRAIGSDGKIYKAKTGTDLAPNVNNNPTTDITNTNWDVDNEFYINSLGSKATPIDTDNFGIQETGGLFKKLSWANIKTVLGSLYVGLTGNQTIAGVKTFSSNIVGNITGNAATATVAADSNKLIGKNWHWLGQEGQPTWLWGGSDETNMYVYSPTHFSVKYANGAGYATAFTTAVGSAPSYACRAWVNFNGTGTVAIRASGNVSSITDNGVGDYTVNFTTAMPDANYSSVGLGGVNNYAHLYIKNVPTTTSLNVIVGVGNSIAPTDILFANIAIFR